jgi:hypothetical protein
MVIELTSPLTTALYQTLQEDPKTTSPMIVAFSAIKQSCGINGLFSLTVFISIVKKSPVLSGLELNF